MIDAKDLNSLLTYSTEAERKACDLTDLLDVLSEPIGDRVVDVYRIRQFARELKQYTDDAFKIAEKLVADYEETEK